VGGVRPFLIRPIFLWGFKGETWVPRFTQEFGKFVGQQNGIEEPLMGSSFNSSRGLSMPKYPHLFWRKMLGCRQTGFMPKMAKIAPKKAHSQFGCFAIVDYPVKVMAQRPWGTFGKGNSWKVPKP